MSRRIRSLSPLYWLTCSALVWLGVLGGVRLSARDGAPAQAQAVRTSPQAAQNPPTKAPPTKAPPTPIAKKPGGFIGEAACVDCHDSQKEGYFESNHHRVTDPRTPGAKDSCETCHGPAGAHADDPVLNPIKDFNKLPPKEVTAVCTTCHNRGEHALWEGSQHQSRGLTCTTCHSVHQYKSESAQLKKETQAQVCAQCHRDKVAKLDRSGHMPVREGKMQCTSCHNTHGSTNVRMLRKGDSVSELCTSCHAEKRGPFLWEHGPSRDGCVTCHDPHGSSNDRMLVVRTPMLCQRCHVSSRHPSTIYDAGIINTSVRVYARSCVTCHAAIHGSNHPRGQRFIR